MKIIRPGKPKLKPIFMFSCGNCGCLFETWEHELGPNLSHKCPTCSRLVYPFGRANPFNGRYYLCKINDEECDE